MWQKLIEDICHLFGSSQSVFASNKSHVIETDCSKPLSHYLSYKGNSAQFSMKPIVGHWRIFPRARNGWNADFIDGKDKLQKGL